MAKRKPTKRTQVAKARRSAPRIDARTKGLVQATEPLRDSDWAKLDPAFRTRLAAALTDLERTGTPFKMVEGFRTVERQQWLYGSGRPNVLPYGRPGPIVTHRDGVKKRSNHQGTGEAGSGRGADCYPTRNGKVYIPPSSDPIWNSYADALGRQGLIPGHRWTTFKDSAHAELIEPTPAATRKFIKSIVVPTLRRKVRSARRAAAVSPALVPTTFPTDLETKSAAALVAGSGLIMAEEGVPAQTKRDIVNSTLAAQFAASHAVPDRKDVMRWYTEYFNALQRLGWVMTSQDFREHRHGGATAQVHKAIMTVLSVALGPAAATLAVVKAVLDGLEEIDNDNGWLTLFDREAVSAEVANFQVITAQPLPGGQVNLGLLAFSLKAKKRVTQVLFFKFKKSNAVMQFAGGTASINEDLVALVREPLRKQLEQAALDFVASIRVPVR